MLSGMLAGFLKVAAVAVVTGGFAGGIYWAVQISESDGSPLLQAETTLTAAPPTTLTLTPPQPTPVPIDPPALDTSEWLTFSSPLGFDVKYPPTWRLIDISVSDVPHETARILNERAIAEREANRSGKAYGTIPPPGVAWIDISPGPLSGPLSEFDSISLKAICGSAADRELGTSRTRDVLVAGRPAVSCIQDGTTFDGASNVREEALWIEAPSGRAVSIISYQVLSDTTSDEILAGTLQSTLASLDFR